MNRQRLYFEGYALLAEFCRHNELPHPEVRTTTRDDWRIGTCAYYRPSYIAICIDKCANIGLAGRQWSYPGYTVDRTPYGVLQHELGHHVDMLKSERRGPYFGDFSIALRAAAGEAPISGYCPNDAEWFAEMFRLFVTNPNLLCLTRPRTYCELARYFKPLFTDSWHARLNSWATPAPDRIIKATERKILK